MIVLVLELMFILVLAFILRLPSNVALIVLLIAPLFKLVLALMIALAFVIV